MPQLTRELDQPGKCADCGIRPRRNAGYYRDGTRKYSRYCNSCKKKRYCKGTSTTRKRLAKSYRKRRREVLVGDLICARCGFIPEGICQMDVDHIDGNSANDVPENRQTLCANCHRLKTKLNGDHLTPIGVSSTEQKDINYQLFN